MQIIIRSLTRAAIAGALVTATAAAQTAGAGSDVSGPGGGGGGLGGAIAPIGVPSTGGGTTSPTSPTAAPTPAATSAISGLSSSLSSAPAGGVTFASPGGGTVTVPQAVAQTLGAVLGGGSPSSVAALTSTLSAGGLGTQSAGALSNALGALGATPNFANYVSAVQSFNAAIASLPAGSTPSPALLAVRAALVSFQAN